MNQVKLIYHGVIYSKKNSKRIITNSRTGQPMITSSHQAKLNEETMAQDFFYQTVHLLDNPLGQEKPLEVSIKIWQKDRRRRDLDNQATAILDALVAGGVMEDDDAKVVQKMTVELGGYDKEDPRAEIIVKEKEEISD